jgi:2-polyprenyl-3-methyl-5-hydroxy-6-metoxy-1,4-benzoquinol methylase
MQHFVPLEARRLLDVGCHTGAFGQALKQTRDIEIWGMEPANAPASVAATRLDKVITEPLSAASSLPSNYFDVIVFNDVLEHMEAPWDALMLARRWLAPDGCIVVSLPNVLHVNNLEHMLLQRDFCYEGRGVRDRTHLRFFSRKSALRMFDECGYVVTTVAGINETWWSPSLLRRLAFKILARWLDELKPLQFAFVLKLRAA